MQSVQRKGGVARLDQNRRALALGRFAALEPERVEGMRRSRRPPERLRKTLEDIVEYRQQRVAGIPDDLRLASLFGRRD